MVISPRYATLWAVITMAYGVLAHVVMVQLKFDVIRPLLFVQFLLMFGLVEILRLTRWAKLAPYTFSRGGRLVFVPTLCWLLAEERVFGSLNTAETPYFAVVHCHFPLVVALGELARYRQRPHAWHILLIALVALSCYGSKLTVLIAYDYEFWRLIDATVALLATAILLLWTEYAAPKISLAEFFYAHLFNGTLVNLYWEYRNPQLLDIYMDLRYESSPPASFYAWLISFAALGVVYQFMLYLSVFKNGALATALVGMSASDIQIGVMYLAGMYASLFTEYPNALGLIGTAVNIGASLAYAVLSAKSPLEWRELLQDERKRRRPGIELLARVAMPLLNDGSPTLDLK